jgi:hypothetical protein
MGREPGTPIERENALLEELTGALRERRPWDDWSVEARAYLRGALAEGGSPHDRARSIRLREHLFGGYRGPPDDPSLHHSRYAERVRADLPERVPYGAGCYLIDPRPSGDRESRSPDDMKD